MKKVLISLFVLLSAITFSEVKEIQMIGLSNSILTEATKNDRLKKINGNKTSILKYEEAAFQAGNTKEYVLGMREYRPQVLKNIDEKIAVPQNRGILKSLNREYDRELKNYLEMIAYNSEQIFFLANQYVMMNDYEKANMIFLMDSKDFKNIFGAATTYRFLGKNEEAVQKYSEAISRDGSFAESYLGRALANRNLDNYDSAIDDLKTYISMSGSLEGYLALGDIYFKLNKKNEAYNIVNKGLGKYPSSKLLRTLGSNIYKN